MKKTILALLAALALFLGGCAMTGGSVADDAPAGTNADPEIEEAADEEEPESEESAVPVNPTFGDAFTWENGLSVKISKPKKFQPSEYAFVNSNGTALRFTVTVVNHTGANYDAGMDYITVQSGNTEAEQIFDSENGLQGAPSTKLLDGREAKYDVGFMVAKPNDIVMEFSPLGDFSLENVIFTN